MKRIYIIAAVVLIVTIASVIFYKWDKDQLSLPLNQKITSIINKTINNNSKTSIDHIVIITMENKSYEDIVNNQDAPYINSLIHKHSFSDNYFAVSHPSLPNYIAMIGGNTFGINTDCTDCHVNSTNLVDQLEQTNKTWKAYMESMPTACFSGSAGEYAQKHNPFIYFDDIKNNPNRCKNIVPFTQLQTDLKSENTTANFIWISPNLCNDMHDCSVEKGDTWLSEQIPLILKSPAFSQQKSLLVITWDEGETSGDNKVPLLLIGNSVKQGFVSHNAYTHYSLLHTIENLWNISPLTMNVSNAPIMSDLISIPK